jgi:hypothetical protein
MLPGHFVWAVTEVLFRKYWQFGTVLMESRLHMVFASPLYYQVCFLKLKKKLVGCKGIMRLINNHIFRLKIKGKMLPYWSSEACDKTSLLESQLYGG